MISRKSPSIHFRPARRDSVTRGIKLTTHVTMPLKRAPQPVLIGLHKMPDGQECPAYKPCVALACRMCFEICIDCIHRGTQNLLKLPIRNFPQSGRMSRIGKYSDPFDKVVELGPR